MGPCSSGSAARNASSRRGRSAAVTLASERVADRLQLGRIARRSGRRRVRCEGRQDPAPAARRRCGPARARRRTAPRSRRRRADRQAPAARLRAPSRPASCAALARTRGSRIGETFVEHGDAPRIGRAPAAPRRPAGARRPAATRPRARAPGPRPDPPDARAPRSPRARRRRRSRAPRSALVSVSVARRSPISPEQRGRQRGARRTCRGPPRLRAPPGPPRPA